MIGSVVKTEETFSETTGVDITGEDSDKEGSYFKDGWETGIGVSLEVWVNDSGIDDSTTVQSYVK